MYLQITLFSCYLVITKLENVFSNSQGEVVYSFTDGYDKYIPPRPVNGTVTEIISVMSVRDISSIDEKEMAITMTFYMDMVWNDNRVTVTDNRPEYARNDINTLSRQQFDDFWKPDIYATNMISMDVKKYYEDLVLMKVLTKTGYVIMDFRQFSELKFRCVMDFRLYPFDVHACPIEFKSFSYTVTELHFCWVMKPRLLQQWNKIPLYELKLQNTNCETVGKSRLGCIAVILSVTREISFHILETYVPSGAMVLISWISFLVPPDVIPGRMVLLVTTLLTLITMYNTIRETAPATSRLKAIEVWIATSIGFVFLALMEYAVVLALKVLTIPLPEATDIDKNKNEINRKLSCAYLNSCSACLNRSFDWLREKEQRTTATTKISSEECNTSESRTRLRKMNKLHLNGTEEIVIGNERQLYLQLNKLDKASLCLFPVCFLVFCIVYWTYYLTERSRIYKEIHDKYNLV